MSSREPFWYCYECNAEMRPIMAPDAHCASCNSTFVEKMDNPTDDPREFAHGGNDAIPEGEMPPLAPMLLGLSQLFGNTARGTPSPFPGSPLNTGGGSGSGLRFEMSSNTGGNTRTWSFGGPNTMNRDAPQRPGMNRNLSSFMRHADGPPTPGSPAEIPGPLMAQYLLGLLSGMPHQHNHEGGASPFAAMFGPENGRWGDYAFSQDALDQIMTEIMENSNAHRPVPATDEIINNLPRDVLEEGSPLLEKDCAVCKEQFSLTPSDPDELVVITLPCKHPYHQDCILPWVKSSGTCPTCRYALVPQPDGHDAAPAAVGGSGSQPRAAPAPGTPSGNPRSSGSPQPEQAGNGLFEQLMGYIRGSQSNDSNDGTSHRPPGGGSASGGSGHGSVPGGWTGRVD